MLHMWLAVLVLADVCTLEEAERLREWLGPHKVPLTTQEMVEFVRKGLTTVRQDSRERGS